MADLDCVQYPGLHLKKDCGTLKGIGFRKSPPMAGLKRVISRGNAAKFLSGPINCKRSNPETVCDYIAPPLGVIQQGQPSQAFKPTISKTYLSKRTN